MASRLGGTEHKNYGDKNYGDKNYGDKNYGNRIVPEEATRNCLELSQIRPRSIYSGPLKATCNWWSKVTRGRPRLRARYR
jgi:hypothetical protein